MVYLILTYKGYDMDVRFDMRLYDCYILIMTTNLIGWDKI